MREIKFRAWVPSKNKWADGVTFDDEGNAGIDYGYYDEVYEDAIIEQFTGLKDKNGTEMYDGDIVNILLPEGYHISCDNPGTVVWEQHTARWQLSNWPAHSYPRESLEIIGNIHENPELMEKKDVKT